MTRSRYFFNSSVIRQNMRQHGWIGIMYTLGLLFSLPLQLFTGSYPDAEPQKIDSLFRVGGNIQMLFVLSLPVAAGLFLFRYLQSKTASDLWHSLPLRREHLLTAHLASGLGLLLLPVWLTAAVTAIVTPLEGNMYIYSGADIWNWCLTVSVVTLFLFVFSVFVGICTGQTILQGIITYILLILPVALIQLVNSHLSMYLFGYPRWSGLSNSLYAWSPLLRLVTYTNDTFSAVEMWTYAALSVLFLALSFVLYRKRSVEKSGQAIAFTYFNPLFKAGVMLCAMLLFGAYFSEVKSRQLNWTIFGYVAGALLGYIAAEMLVRKTWQIMTRRVPLEFAVYGILLGLLIYIPVSGLTGYESRVPAGDRITGVYAGNNYSMYASDPYNGYSSGRASSGKKVPMSGDQQYIEAVRKLHQALVTVRPGDVPASSTVAGYNRGSRMFTIAYQLDNGRKVLRQYWVPALGFEPEMKTVMENTDFKRWEYSLHGLDEGLESFRLTIRDRSVSISEPEDVQEFKNILTREILNMSYEDQSKGQLARTYIQPVNNPIDEQVDGNTGLHYRIYSYSWFSSYKELGSWLEQKGFTEKIGIRAADVKSAEIIKDDYKGKLSPKDINNIEQHMALARQQKLSSVTQDKALITYILQHQLDYTGENGMYVVKLEYKNGEVQHISLDEQELTSALKSLLP
ncbi:hypothetical protein [Paenibacillus donghaensis]|uniref:ABC-2 type transport system permease protein n=1 Tax=Paenibacillus donghaensis TaxID=414771 RepID=A0A2Z2KKU9_9BACL|nr:hypothetical protein [Paenibacillus donghaensis]ASA21632.1 hypothetical protein B9T62_13140 [Paenibacillus donghaensis]